MDKSGEQQNSKLRDSKNYLSRLLIDNKNLKVIDVSNIHWIESYGNYIKIRYQGEMHIIRGSLKKVVKKFDPQKFIRIHNSTIVNIDKVVAFKPLRGNTYQVEMECGKRLKMSRHYKKSLNKFKL